MIFVDGYTFSFDTGKTKEIVTLLCFKDRTFCTQSSVCANTECGKRMTDELRAEGEKWWGSKDFPVAYGNMKDRCNSFIEPQKLIEHK